LREEAGEGIMECWKTRRNKKKEEESKAITKARRYENTKEEGCYRTIGPFSCLPNFVLS
jgi:hypothetical protein